MSATKPYDPVASDGGRELGETGELLQVDGEWQLEEHDNDDGPVVLHSCGRYMVDLNRRFTMCRQCGAEIPPSMISGFTLLNWNKADDDEYFVHPLNELTDFCYNGHLSAQLRGLASWEDSGTATCIGTDEDTSIDAITAAIDAWKIEKGLT